jgi:hypothetical protein
MRKSKRTGAALLPPIPFINARRGANAGIESSGRDEVITLDHRPHMCINNPRHTFAQSGRRSYARCREMGLTGSISTQIICRPSCICPFVRAWRRWLGGHRYSRTRGCFLGNPCTRPQRALNFPPGEQGSSKLLDIWTLVFFRLRRNF